MICIKFTCGAVQVLTTPISLPPKPDSYPSPSAPQSASSTDSPPLDVPSKWCGFPCSRRLVCRESHGMARLGLASTQRVFEVPITRTSSPFLFIAKEYSIV